MLSGNICINCETIGNMVRSVNETYLNILSPFPKCDFDTNEVSALSIFVCASDEIRWNEVRLYMKVCRKVDIRNFFLYILCR